MNEICVCASGMVTAVGLNSPASCAAIRCGITNFAETRFMGRNGEWITGSSVPLEKPWRGRAKLVHMVAPAIRECLNAAANTPPEQIPLMLCVAEKDRPGRFEGLEDKLFGEVQEELGLHFHEASAVIPRGRVGGAYGVRQATSILNSQRLSYCIVAGVDTFLTAETLAEFENRGRILTETNSDGFIPGEAGAAVLLCLNIMNSSGHLIIKGIGFGKEEATIESGEPLRADGLVSAFKEALSNSMLSMHDLDYRITDANGEQYKFKEADLAVTRMLRAHSGKFDIWHPAGCVGEIGAATVSCIIAVSEAAARKCYSEGDNVLCHFGNDTEERAALILTYYKIGNI